MLGSPVDIALVAGIALIAFGPKKLPELGKSVGLGIANFKAALLLPVAEDGGTKHLAATADSIVTLSEPVDERSVTVPEAKAL